MERVSATTSTTGEVRPEHDRPAGSDLVLVHYIRGLALPVVEVWEYLTDPDRLAGWFGTVHGDPATKAVRIASDDAQLVVGVVHCVAPHELYVTVDGAMLECRLYQVGVVTTLELVRRHLHPADVATAGPRWQYHLDRLEAALNETPLPEWSAYIGLSAEYRCPG